MQAGLGDSCNKAPSYNSYWRLGWVWAIHATKPERELFSTLTAIIRREEVERRLPNVVQHDKAGGATQLGGDTEKVECRCGARHLEVAGAHAPVSVKDERTVAAPSCGSTADCKQLVAA